MKHFDIFTRFGGFTIACERVGNIETIGFSEIDKYANMVLKYHWPEVKNYGDITKIKTDELPDFDLLTGGSPCQSWSLAGNREGFNGTSGLFSQYVRILTAKKPKYFLWENVKGVLSSNNGFDFCRILNDFSEAGYNLWWQVVNATWFGIPQNRERIFVFGVRADRGSPREILFKPENDGVFNKKRKSGTGRTQADNFGTVRNNPMKADGTFVKQKSVVNNKRTQECRIRKLLPIETERLMDIPDEWTKYGIDEKGNKVEISDSQRYKLCGNGIVVRCAEYILREQLRGELNGHKKP